MFQRKKTLIILFAIILVFVSIAPIALAANFVDVGNTWYRPGIQFVAERGFMGGVGDNRFAPQANLSRAMLATVLWRIEGSPNAATPNPFTDVADGQWYTMAVRWARETGVVNGTSATTFAPHHDITRQEVVTMFSRYAARTGMSVAVPPHVNLNAFTDRGNVASWAVDSMRWAVHTGIMSGTSATTLSPTNNATRAEAATLIMRLANLIDTPTSPLPPPPPPSVIGFETMTPFRVTVVGNPQRAFTLEHGIPAGFIVRGEELPINANALRAVSSTSRRDRGITAHYVLDGNFARFTSYFAVTDGSVQPVTVSIIGDNRLLGSFVAGPGNAPLSIDLPLDGIETLQITFTGHSASDHFAHAALYDARFYPAS